jgi:Tol biopolymer transport system component/DNA-binding winged helix-turn-helix (wHTH) protein
MRTTTARTAVFGPYEVDLRSGEARKHGIRLKMGEQPFQILLMLLTNHGEMVAREELRAKLWADDTFVDFDHGLNSAVQRLRDCLSDTAEKPVWIETIPRRGYRFVGQVTFDGTSAGRTISRIPDGDPEPISSPQPIISLGLNRGTGARLIEAQDAPPHSANHEKLELKLIRDVAAEPKSPGTATLAPRWRRVLPWAFACATMLAALALAFALKRSQQSHGPFATESVRFEIPVPANTTLPFLGTFAVSPDGRQLAFAANGSDGVLRLWVRALDSLDARPLLGSESSVNDPFFWSPDSRFIAIDAGGKLKKIDVSGGEAQTLCDAGPEMEGGSWSRDGVIIFGSGRSGKLMQVSADGGTPTPLTTLNASRNEAGHAFFPSFLPDGRHFIYWMASSAPDNRGIYVGSLDAKPDKQDSRILVTTDQLAAYAPSSDPEIGQLLFVRNGALLAQPFDARRLKLTGQPVTVVEQVGFLSAFPFFSASNNGVLIYRTSSGPAQDAQLAWYSRQGKPLGKVGEPGLFLQFALSPDGTHVGVHSIDLQHPASIILLLDLSRGTTTRFTYSPFMTYSSAWSRDGDRIIFVSNHAGKFGLYEKPLNSGKEEELLFESDQNMVATSWSRDGRFLLYFTIDRNNQNDLWVLPLDGQKKPMPFLRTEFNERDAYFSPDGHWVAYDSDETGRREVYVRPFSPEPNKAASGAGPKWLVSAAGGVEPRWRADGRELYYVALDGKLMAVEIARGLVFRAGVAKVLFQTPVAHPEFGLIGVPEPAADGKRFLFEVPPDQATQPPFLVVQNWQSGFKK